MKLMKKAVLLALLTMSLACQQAPKKLIVGKWKDTTAGSEMIFQFFPDGTVKVAQFGQMARPESGISEGEIEIDKYSFPDQSHLMLTDSNSKSAMFDITISPEAMVLTREGNLLPSSPAVFKRIK